MDGVQGFGQPLSIGSAWKFEKLAPPTVKKSSKPKKVPPKKKSTKKKKSSDSGKSGNTIRKSNLPWN